GGGGVLAFLAKGSDGSNGPGHFLHVNRRRLGAPNKEETVSFLDKLLGRGKKTAGDLTGDSSMRKEGMHQEREGMAEERAGGAEDRAQEARQEAAEHHAQRDTT